MKRTMRKINPSRADVAKSLRNVAELWRAPDPENDNARMASGAGETKIGLDNGRKSTPSAGETQRGRA